MTTFHDLRFAFRALRKRAGTTTVAIAILALGIGACAIVFSLVRGLVLKPLAFSEPDQLVRIYGTQASVGGDRLRLSEGTFFDWRRQSHSFESLIAARNMGLPVTGTEQALNPLMRQISADYFPTLGAPPLLGRTFRVEENRLDARVAILSFGFWQGYLGGDPAIIGQTIELANEPYEIVGVMPADYRNPALGALPVLWLPMAEPAEPDRRRTNLVVIGRLADGVSRQQADAEIAVLTAELGERYPSTDGGRGARVIALHHSLIESVRPALLALLGAVGFVLLIACTNVANLLLAKAVERRGEIALRRALGAERRHLVRQMLTESLLLGTLAATLGLLLATWSIGPLLSLAPSNTSVPLLERVEIDRATVIFTFSLALLTSAVFGLLPLLQIPGRSAALASGSQRAGSSRRRGRLRGALVIAEVALSLVLLVTAGLMARSFVALRGLDLGFEEKGLVVFRASARGAQFQEPARYADFHRQVLDKLRALPGVDRAGTCDILPMFSSFRPMVPLRRSREEVRSRGELVQAIPLGASPDFLRTFGLPLVAGRDFTADDHADHPAVAIISQGLVGRLWGAEDPLGQELILGAGDDEHRVRVVGVAGDVRGLATAPEAPPNLYLPYRQAPALSISFFLRTNLAPDEIFAAAEQAVWSISREAPVYATATLEQIVRDIEWQPRFIGQLLGGLAVFALVLAASGLYAVLSYAVSERGREIAIRQAVGARRRDIVTMVLADAARLTAIGTVIGLLGAWSTSRLLAGQLYGVRPDDPLTYATIAAILGLVALLAAYMPARRATMVDPARALGSD